MAVLELPIVVSPGVEINGFAWGCRKCGQEIDSNIIEGRIIHWSGCVEIIGSGICPGCGIENKIRSRIYSDKSMRNYNEEQKRWVDVEEIPPCPSSRIIKADGAWGWRVACLVLVMLIAWQLSLLHPYQILQRLFNSKVPVKVRLVEYKHRLYSIYGRSGSMYVGQSADGKTVYIPSQLAPKAI